MSVVFKFKGDARGVLAALNQVRGGIGGIQSEMGKMSWAEFAVGLNSALDLLGQAKDALAGLVSSVMRPAAALEEAGVKLGVMFGDRAAGDELAKSLQRIATNGVIPLEELEAAAGALIGKFKNPKEIADWVSRFADLAATGKVTASRFAEMVARLDDMGKAEFTELANKGIPIYQALADVMDVSVQDVIALGKEGKVSADDLLDAFRRLTDEGGKFHNMNAERSNTTLGSWETLKASIDEVLAEVGKPLNDAVRPVLQDIAGFLQEYHEGLATMLKLGLKFSAVWMGFKTFDLAAHLYKCVAALVAMRSTANGVHGVFKSMGRVGWMLLLTGAIEALTRLRDAWRGDAGVDASEEEDESEGEEWRERLAKRAAIDREKMNAYEQQRVFESQSRDEFREKMADWWDSGKMQTVEDWKKRGEALRGVESWLNGLDGDFDVEKGELDKVLTEHVRLYGEVVKREAALAERERLAEQQAELNRREDNRKQAGYEAKTEARIEEFKGKHAWERELNLKQMFEAQGLKWYADKALRDVQMAEALRKAAADNDMGRYNRLVHLGRWSEAHEEMQGKEAERKVQREEALREVQYEGRRAAAVARGDMATVERMDAERDFIAEKKALMDAGLGEQEAAYYAAGKVQRARAEKKDGSQVQMVASSLASVGGGGTAHRLGDAQLDVAKKQLAAEEAMRDFLSSINKKLTGTGIPVVL